MKRTVLVLGLVLGAMRLDAQVFSFTGINGDIPDGDPNGLVNVQTVSGHPGFTIQDVNVTLSISGTGLGGFNGDLYVYLQHKTPDETYAVLLNRVGFRNGNQSGYSDSGLNIGFDDDTLGRDVHNYRLILNGDHDTPISGPLTGTWEADGRALDASFLVSSSRGDGLGLFDGELVDGTWTLFVSDLNSGGTHRLESWGMEITAVPEASTYGVVTGLGLIAYSLVYRRRRLRKARRARR